MVAALKLAKNQPDGCISKGQAHHRTLNALVKLRLLTPTSGFGWQHGGIYELTEKGEQALEKIME